MVGFQGTNICKPAYESHNNKNFNRVGDQSFEQGRWFVNMSLNRIRNYRFELWIAMVRTSFRRFSSWISVMVSRISATNCKSLNFDLNFWKHSKLTQFCFKMNSLLKSWLSHFSQYQPRQFSLSAPPLLPWISSFNATYKYQKLFKN